MSVVVAKVCLSVFLVVGLVLIAERNPKIGGLLAGLPLGTGIMVLFYSIELGIPFVLQGIPYGIAGLVSALSFGMGFYLGGKLWIRHRFGHILSALIGGSFAFLGSGLLIEKIPMQLHTSVLIFGCGTVLAIRFYKHVLPPTIHPPRPFSWNQMMFRAVIVTGIVLLITGIAEQVGPQWAGILASFPTVLCPMLVILAFGYQNALYPSVLKHFSYSISTLSIFYLLVWWLLPTLGLVYGLISCYLICFVYLFSLNKVKTFLSTMH